MSGSVRQELDVCRCRTNDSVAVVLFSLVPNGTHDHIVADNFKQDNVASYAKRHDQLARTAIAQFRLTAGVWRPGQQTHSMADCVERALRRRPIRYFTRELALDGEIFQPLKIRNCF